MIIPTITLENVPVSKLKQKISSYNALFDATSHNKIIKVKGLFSSKDGQIALLEHEFHTVHLEESQRLWLMITVDGNKGLLRAEHDILDAVQITVFQK